MDINEYVDYLTSNSSRQGKLSDEQFAMLLSRIRYEVETYGFSIVPDDGLDSKDLIRVHPHLHHEDGLNAELFQKFHRHECYEMVYIYRGKFCNSFPNQEKPVIMEKDELLLMNSKILHSVYTMTPDTVAFDILISKTLMENRCLSLLRDNPLFSFFFQRDIYSANSGPRYLYFRTGNQPHIIELVQRLIDESINDRACRESVMQAMLVLIFAELSRVQADTDYDLDTARTLEFYDVICYMTDHCRDVTLEALAEEFHYSENYISKWFQKTANRNFREVLRDIRLAQAAQKLEDTVMDISDISQEVGFRDVANFQRLFRDKFGESPRAWRRNRARANSSD